MAKLLSTKLLMFARITLPEPGEVSAEAATVARFVNITMLFVPGGPKPPAVAFVQFWAVDQFVPAPLAPVQTSVPGNAAVLLLTTRLTVKLFVSAAPPPLMLSA